MAEGPSITEIKALLQSRVLALAQELAPDGRRNGAYWMARNPTRADRHAGSFFVWISGGAAVGAWKDMAGDSDAGGADTGDVIDLIRYCKGLGPRGSKEATAEAIKWAKDWLGIARMPEGERRAIVQRQAERTAAVDADAVERAAKARKAAMATFIASKKAPFAGSPADRYLASRGIDVRRLGRMPGALGWLDASKHFETGTTWPVMVAGFTGDVDGQETIVAVHRTFLAPDGSGKAPVEPQRKIWPAFAGASIRLWRGGTRMSVDEAARHGIRETLVIAEGVEDGLTIALAAPELRVWAAGSLGNIARIVLPECVDEVVVLRDNDWGKPQAARAFAKAIDALVRQERKVRVASATIGKDVNDQLRGVTI